MKNRPEVVRAAVGAYLAGRLLHAADLARLAHEVIEAQLFRQMMTGGPLGDVFAEHVVDDLVLPVLDHRRQGG
jgi:hypothetical protein